MLNELKIKEYCGEHGFGYKYFHDIVVITTGTDTWKLELIDVFDRETKGRKEIIRVNHLNKAANKSKKMHFHKQRYAYDIDYVFNNIIATHKNGHATVENVFRMKNILSNNI